jgi:hypothetical protein
VNAESLSAHLRLAPAERLHTPLSHHSDSTLCCKGWIAHERALHPAWCKATIGQVRSVWKRLEYSAGTHLCSAFLHHPTSRPSKHNERKVVTEVNDCLSYGAREIGLAQHSQVESTVRFYVM